VFGFNKTADFLRRRARSQQNNSRRHDADKRARDDGQICTAHLRQASPQDPERRWLLRAAHSAAHQDSLIAEAAAGKTRATLTQAKR
jgi:hypothetical protein